MACHPDTDRHPAPVPLLPCRQKLLYGVPSDRLQEGEVLLDTMQVRTPDSGHPAQGGREPSLKMFVLVSAKQLRGHLPMDAPAAGRFQTLVPLPPASSSPPPPPRPPGRRPS